MYFLLYTRGAMLSKLKQLNETYEEQEKVKKEQVYKRMNEIEKKQMEYFLEMITDKDLSLWFQNTSDALEKAAESGYKYLKVDLSTITYSKDTYIGWAKELQNCAKDFAGLDNVYLKRLYDRACDVPETYKRYWNNHSDVPCIVYKISKDGYGYPPEFIIHFSWSQ
jgi:hypothetical protein